MIAVLMETAETEEVTEMKATRVKFACWSS
jgi:hypothetical protein